MGADSLCTQADHVRNGSAKNIMDLQVPETTALWEGIKNREHSLCPLSSFHKVDGALAVLVDDFEKFWSVNEKLLTPQSGPIKLVPLRLYIPTTPRVIQAPVSPYVEGTDSKLTRMRCRAVS